MKILSVYKGSSIFFFWLSLPWFKTIRIYDLNKGKIFQGPHRLILDIAIRGTFDRKGQKIRTEWIPIKRLIQEIGHCSYLSMYGWVSQEFGLEDITTA